MKVLFVTSEALPFAASGGLGDVAGSLPQAIRAGWWDAGSSCPYTKKSPNISRII